MHGRAQIADWRGVPVLVTGGAGFIGRHLVQALIDAGASVRVLDDDSTGDFAKVPSSATCIHAGIEDGAAVLDAVAGVVAVFHLAAIVSVPQCQEDPDHCHAINVLASKTVAEAAHQAGATLTFASSCAVYGTATKPPIAESAMLSPESAYAQSKRDAELVIEQLAQQGMQHTCLRLFNVIGPGQRADSAYAAVAAAFARGIMEGAPLRVDGDGRQTRDFVPVKLVVETMLRVGLCPTNTAVNVGTGHPCDLLSLIAMLEQAADRSAKVTHAPPRDGDIKHSWANVDRLRAILPADVWQSELMALEPVMVSLLAQYSGGTDVEQICT